jgi:hypothetical protein
MSTAWIRVSYGFVLGIVLAITVGFGIATFLTEPKPPQPLGFTFSQLTSNGTDQENQRQAKQIDSFYADAQTYREKYPDYQRNLFVALVGAGLLMAVIGVALPSVVNYIRFGFLLGGIALVSYATWFALQPIPNGAPAGGVAALLSAGTPKTLDTAGRFLRFAVAIVGLLVLLFVGLWRLTDWTGSAEQRVEPVAPARVSPAVAAPAPVYDPPAPAARAPLPDSLKWARPEERVDEPEPVRPVGGQDEGTTPTL